MYLFRRVLHLLESLFHFIRFFVGSFFRPSTRTDWAYSPVLRDHLPMTFHDDATLADISSSLCCEPIVRTPRRLPAHPRRTDSGRLRPAPRICPIVCTSFPSLRIIRDCRPSWLGYFVRQPALYVPPAHGTYCCGFRL